MILQDLLFFFLLLSNKITAAQNSWLYIVDVTHIVYWAPVHSILHCHSPYIIHYITFIPNQIFIALHLLLFLTFAWFFFEFICIWVYDWYQIIFLSFLPKRKIAKNENYYEDKEKPRWANTVIRQRIGNIQQLE